MLNLMDYTNIKKEDIMNEDELRSIGWKKCNHCLKMKSPSEYYKSPRRDGLTYACRQCHRLKVRSYRKVQGSYNWFYKRLEKIKKRAKDKGLEFNLNVAELKRIKESAECYYCKTKTDVITLDRLDNDKGYIIGNIMPVCYICNKLKGQIPFTLEEMMNIGKSVNSYYKRIVVVDKLALDVVE